MRILILGAAVAKILSVASSSRACKERVGEDHDHRRPRVRGGDRGVRGDPYAGGGPGAATD